MRIQVAPSTDVMVESAEISNPKLVIVVGSLGLASNVIGLFLFHGESKHLVDHWRRPFD
jgi:Co/Zn/Cd efflux system component